MRSAYAARGSPPRAFGREEASLFSLLRGTYSSARTRASEPYRATFIRPAYAGLASSAGHPSSLLVLLVILWWDSRRGSAPATKTSKWSARAATYGALCRWFAIFPGLPHLGQCSDRVHSGLGWILVSRPPRVIERSRGRLRSTMVF